jgi:hypothetical protein
VFWSDGFAKRDEFIPAHECVQPIRGHDWICGGEERSAVFIWKHGMMTSSPLLFAEFLESPLCPDIDFLLLLKEFLSRTSFLVFVFERSSNIVSLFKELENIRIDA